MNRNQLTIVVLVLLGSLILRLHNYAIYPQRGATSDEYSYSFLGVSLLTTGIPVSWSAFGAYENRYDLTIKNLYFPIVSPYFDHPPLNGIIVGGWAMLFGENSFKKIELATIRLIPIFFSLVSSILLFGLAWRCFGYLSGLWALIIYTTTTIFVIQGRVVLAENLLTTLYLTTIYLYLKWWKKLTVARVLVLGIFSGLAVWTKELGITVCLALLLLFISERVRLRRIGFLILTTMLFILFYILYGTYYDAHVFWKIINLQTSREVGTQTLHYILSTPIIINKIYYDGWYFLGFLGLAFSLLDFRKNRFIVIPWLSYFFLLLFALTQKGEMGWYLIPLFPFMAITTARLIILSLERFYWLFLLPIIFLGQYNVRYIFESNFGLVPQQFRILLLLLVVPWILALFLRRKALLARLGRFYFYLFILGNIYLTYTYIHPA